MNAEEVERFGVASTPAEQRSEVTGRALKAAVTGKALPIRTNHEITLIICLACVEGRRRRTTRFWRLIGAVRFESDDSNSVIQ